MQVRSALEPAMRRLLLLPLLALLALPLRASTPAGDAAPPAAATAVPAPPAWLGAMDARYDARIRVAGLEDRRFAPEHWWDVAMPLLSARRGFHVETLGDSVEGRPLRHVHWGDGSVPVLLWSQMHGDESTATMALADLFRFLGEHPRDPLVRRLRAGTRLHVVPILNPDGAARFQRRNAQGIDINRDARALVTPEARALHDLRERIRPQFGFNLHDQQVGYRAGDSARGTAIALLAPAFNEAREVDAARGRAIEVSVAIRAVLEPYIAGHIAKWDDTYNPRAFGDLTAGAGVATVLIESGGIEGDLHKQRLRKLNFLALLAALDAIATGAHRGLPHAAYDALPENGEVWPDLRIAGAKLVLPGQAPVAVDVDVAFREPLLERGGRIHAIGDLGGIGVRRRIEAGGLYLIPMATPVPASDSSDCACDEGSATTSTTFAIGRPARFHLSRDPQGRDIVWTLAGDVDPARPSPPGH